MIQLLYYDALGDWTFINESSAKIQAVTPDDIMRVAKTYFPEQGRNVMWHSRKEGSEEDPELAALSGQAKQMAKGMLAQIAASESAEELEVGLGQMQGALGQVPPEIKPAIELVIRRMQERIEELRSGGEGK
jgi:hypothetical protein